LGYEKNLETLKEAFDLLSKNRRDLKLLIVGGGKKEISNYLQGNNVILTGQKDDVIPYYQAMDIYVLPSLTETTSLTTLEAMSCGIPVITTPVGLTKEYVKEDVNGFFFREEDAPDLARKLSLLIDDPERRDQMGFEARKTVVEGYRWLHTKKKVREVLKKVSDKSA